MSSEAQAGTPAAEPESRETSGDPGTPADGSGLNAQQQKEWMALKTKAEAFNKLEKEKAELEARLAQMERLAVSRGAGTATDPEAERYAQIREQAAFDPLAAEVVTLREELVLSKAERWLERQMKHVPEAKQELVATLVRNTGYQIDANEALKRLTDPQEAEVQRRLAELEAENARLKERAVIPNGASPATTPTPPAGGGTTRETIPWSEVLSTLKGGGKAAKEMRDKMDSGAIKPDYRQ